MSNINFLRDTIDLVSQIETRHLELASRLYKIQDERLWEGEFDTFQDFLQLAKISTAKASMLTNVHKHFAIDGNIPQDKLAGIPYSSLYEAIPLLETRKHSDVVEVARMLTRDEIKAETRELKHGECEHPEKITICGKCKKRIS